MARWIIPAALMVALVAGVAVMGRCQPGGEKPGPAAAGSATAAAPMERGNTMEVYGSANWSWGRYAGYKFDLAFQATQSKTLNAVYIVWKTASGYGAGNYGTWTFELHADDPTGHIPATKILSTLKNQRHPPEGYYKISLPKVALTAGAIYHLVMYNTDFTPAKNWSSPNTVMSRPDNPWQGQGVMSFDGKQWTPWGSQDNRCAPYQGGRAAYLLTYTDGSSEGMPYYSGKERYIYGNLYEGESFSLKTDATVAQIGFPVYTYGTPAGPLSYVLEEVGGTQLAGGTLAQPSQITEVPAWQTLALSPAVTLQQGKTYRISLRAPGCTSQQNCYAVCVPYSSEQVTGWPALTWDGTAGYDTFFDGKAWQQSPVPADMSFSLVCQ